MRSRLGWRVAVGIVVLGMASAVGLLPADAVQTAKFGLAATGARSKIVHAATDRPIHDSVVVYNRTARSLTVSLDVVGVTQQANGSYSLGASGAGLAAHVELQTRSVQLAARGRQTVALTIEPPDGHLSSPEYAAVTAIAGPATSPGVSVTERLAVLVGLTPSGSGSTGSHDGSHKRTVAVVVATVLLLALLALLIAWFTLRRRRSAADPTP